MLLLTRRVGVSEASVIEAVPTSSGPLAPYEPNGAHMCMCSISAEVEKFTMARCLPRVGAQHGRLRWTDPSAGIKRALLASSRAPS